MWRPIAIILGFSLLINRVVAQCCSSGCPSGQYCLCNATASIDTCALQLSAQNSTFNVTGTTSYYYFQPSYENYDIIQMVFCGSNIAGASNLLLVEVEKQPGDYPYPQNSENATFNATSQCLGFYVTGATFETMSNGQRQNLLMALTLNITGIESMTSYVIGQQSQGYLFTILFSSIGVLVLIFVIIGGALLWRRCRTQKAINITNDLAHLDKYMPVVRLQQTEIVNPVNCSVCLVDINLNENTRRTPCEHYFHELCINDWCKKTLNCPVCREDFSDQSFQERLRRSTRPVENTEPWHTNQIQNGLIDDNSRL